MAPRPRALVVAVCGRRSRGSGACAVVAVSVPLPAPQPASRAATASALFPGRGRVARSGVGSRLAQQRTGRLLEDLAPGADLLLLGREVRDDLAHAGGGDLDAVALADLAEVVVVLRELERDGLEAVLGDLDARGEVEDRRLEHQLVVGLRLDKDD